MLPPRTWIHPRPARRASRSSRARSVRSWSSAAIVATGLIRARERRACASIRWRSLLRGGDSGPAIVRGEPDQSLLILAVRHDGAVSMPPKIRSSRQAEIDALAAWVKMGRPWPDYTQGSRPASSPDGRAPGMTRAARGSGRFRPPAVPTSADGRRSILAPFADRRLHPGAAGGRRAAAGAAGRSSGPCSGGRRSTCWGIPPSPEEIDAFLRDDSAAGLRAGRRPPAGVAALRRALGPALAGRRRATPTATAWTTTSPTPTPGAIAIT